VLKSRAKARRRYTPRSAKNADWAFHAADDEVLAALAEGRHEHSLREYFGAPAYLELKDLALRAEQAGKSTRKKSARTPLLILPGIMGSRLGRSSEVLWIDPLQIADGRLVDLRLPSTVSFKPMGVLLFSYARLLLTLRAAGFQADFHAYDWRKGLEELGKELSLKIEAQRRPFTLIAHSMGALVARSALPRLPKRSVRQLLMLGAPNLGSFASVQALRGTYPFVRKLSSLDRKNSPEALAEKVFCTFTGLYQMLPPARHTDGINLFDPLSWPKDGPVPDPALLVRAATARAGLAPVDQRMVHIVGVNQETVVGLRRTTAGFQYIMNKKGDGTVPLALAKLPKLKAYFVDEAHADLANNPRVIQAIVDLLRRGRTRALPERWRSKPDANRYIDDARLRTENGPKIDWRRLTPPERERVFAALDSGRLLPAAAHPLA
jgi:pimeloyl-ACP methyl ester carboxylesterase